MGAVLRGESVARGMSQLFEQPIGTHGHSRNPLYIVWVVLETLLPPCRIAVVPVWQSLCCHLCICASMRHACVYVFMHLRH